MYRNLQDDPSTDQTGSHGNGSNGNGSNGSNGNAFGNSLVSTAPKPSLLSGVRGVGLGLLLGIGVALGGGRLLSSSAPNEAASEPAATTTAASVTVQQVQTAAIQQSLKATGTVQAFDLLQVSPPVSGLQILEMRVRAGDPVVAGQVIAVLDGAVLRTQITQAEANYAQAEAQVAQERAGLAQAEATAAEAQDNLGRYEILHSQGGISLEQLISRRTQAITAREAVGVAQAEIQSAIATVNSRGAELQRWQTQLDQTIVTAPANGQIAERRATVGDTSATGTAIYTMIQDGLLELVIDLPQRQLAAVPVGTPVTITSSTNRNIKLSGAVRSIAPQVDQQTRQAAVNVSLPSSSDLRTGMFLQADMLTGQRSGTVIPATAVRPQADNSFEVFVMDDGVAKPVLVSVGARLPATDDLPERLEITSGLAEGVSVIVEGASYLQSGDPVTAVTTPFTTED